MGWINIQMTKSQAELKAEEWFFEGHGCLTGDCPHYKIVDCLTHAYLAGHQQCEKDLREEIEKLENHFEHCNSDKIVTMHLEIEKLNALLNKVYKTLRMAAAVVGSLFSECIYHRDDARSRNQYSDALRLSDLELGGKYIFEINQALSELRNARGEK